LIALLHRLRDGLQIVATFVAAHKAAAIATGAVVVG